MVSVRLRGEGTQPGHDFGRLEGVGAGAVHRLEAAGHVDEHAHDAVQLALVRQLDHQAVLHRGEEVAVDLLGHRVHQVGDEELDVEPLRLGQGEGLAADARRAAPADQRQRRVRVALHLEVLGAVDEGRQLLEALLVHLDVHGAAVGRVTLLVVLDARRQVVALGHARVADGADAVVGQLEALVAGLQVRRGGRLARDDLHAGGIERGDRLLALGDLLIGQHHHRRLELLGDVEGVDGGLEGVAHAGGGQHRAQHVAVGRERRLEEVGLLGLGGQARGGAAAHARCR